MARRDGAKKKAFASNYSNFSIRVLKKRAQYLPMR